MRKKSISLALFKSRIKQISKTDQENVLLQNRRPALKIGTLYANKFSKDKNKIATVAKQKIQISQGIKTIKQEFEKEYKILIPRNPHQRIMVKKAKELFNHILVQLTDKTNSFKVFTSLTDVKLYYLRKVNEILSWLGELINHINECIG